MLKCNVEQLVSPAKLCELVDDQRADMMNKIAQFIKASQASATVYNEILGFMIAQYYAFDMPCRIG